MRPQTQCLHRSLRGHLDNCRFSRQPAKPPCNARPFGFTLPHSNSATSCGKSKLFRNQASGIPTFIIPPFSIYAYHICLSYLSPTHSTLPLKRTAVIIRPYRTRVRRCSVASVRSKPLTSKIVHQLREERKLAGCSDASTQSLNLGGERQPQATTPPKAKAGPHTQQKGGK